MPNFLKDMEITFISLVKRGANRRTIIIKTAGGEPIFQREVKIQKIDNENRRFYSLVYAPDEVDAQGDFTSPEEIQKAAYSFMRNLRLLNVDRSHSEKPEKAFIAESWLVRKNDPLFPEEPEGSWAVGIVVENDELWQEIEKGEINAISMGGLAEREANRNISKIWEQTQNQIRHSLRDSKDFDPDSFRTIKISDEKGGIFLVTGKLKGGGDSMVAQSVRFTLKSEDNPNGWTLAEAKKWYEDHKSKFEKSWDEMTISKAAIEDNVADILELDLSNNRLMLAIYKALEKLGIKPKKGGTNMNEEKIQELINKSIEPLHKKLDEVGQQSFAEEQMAEIIKIAIQPLSERVEKLEKTTNGSKQDDGDIEKNADLEKIGNEIAKKINIGGDK